MLTDLNPDHATPELKLAIAALDTFAEGGKALAVERAGKCKGCFHCAEMRAMLNALNVAVAAETDARTGYRAVLHILAEQIAEHFSQTSEEARQALAFERNLAQETGEIKETLMELAKFFKKKEPEDDERDEDTPV